ncbi:MAG TPA: hypothetical protein VGS02_08940 [Acidobacteriaceae bacterium]|nr:hypothetical protein [Acidobacteriaceae bacterium]
MIEVMPQIHMTEAEAARDFHAVLRRVREGAEVIVEEDHRAVAVIRPAPAGRRISEVLQAMEASGANAVIDEDFARDVEEGISAHREPWNPPSWD